MNVMRAFFLFLLAVLTSVLFAACEYKITGYPQVPRTTTTGAVTHVYVNVHWVNGVDDFRTIDCRGKNMYFTTYECVSVSVDKTFPDTATCDLYTVKPKDFMDQLFLTLLGHGMLHCLGATHE